MARPLVYNYDIAADIFAYNIPGIPCAADTHSFALAESVIGHAIMASNDLSLQISKSPGFMARY